MTGRIPRTLGVVAAAVLCAAWMATLRPGTLGGPAAYVMVRGVSMLPTYHTGDLVIAHHQHAYAKGDIVAYRVPSGIGKGEIVIHRIVGGSAGGGYLMQGDNNPTPDPWHPRLRDVVGKAWLHVPRAGYVLAWLHAPVPLASLGAGIAAAFMLVPAGDDPPLGDANADGEDAVVDAEEDKRVTLPARQLDDERRARVGG